MVDLGVAGMLALGAHVVINDDLVQALHEIEALIAGARGLTTGT